MRRHDAIREVAARGRNRVFLVLALVFIGCFSAFCGPVPEKLRILVDKVMQPEEDWVTKEWMVKEAAQAGFNVFSPRRGYERLEEVRKVAAWCSRYGLKYMPWMRGSLAAPATKEAEGKRLVWANGVEQPLWSPNSDQLWRHLHKYIEAFARLSMSYPSLIGVFLDFENYAPGRQGNCYSLSYDKAVLEAFAEDRGINIPRIAPVERSSYLKGRGLEKAFASFQIALWRKRCRKLREAVDKYNPSFLFCVYPAPGTPFIREAVYSQWATSRAPLLLADAVSYGRPSRFALQKEALLRNQKRLLERREIPRKAGINHLYLGGIDPAVRGADPEFCGRNALMIAGICDGYWVFYEGPTYRGTHRRYFHWFAWANERIRKGRFKEAFGDRVTPEAYFNEIFGRVKKFPPKGIFSDRRVTRKYKRVCFRGPTLFFLRPQAHAEVVVRLRNIPVGKYQSPLGYEFRTSGGRVIESGTIPFGKSGELCFEAQSGEVLALALSAGGCAFAVESSNVPLCVADWGRGVRTVYGAQRLYFLVPQGKRRFSLQVSGSGSETVKLRVFNAHRKEVGAWETTLSRDTVRQAIEVGPEGSGIWSLELGRAAVGVLEDSALSIKGVPGFLFLDPADARLPE